MKVPQKDLSKTGIKLNESSNSVMKYNQQVIESVHVVKQGAEQTAISSGIRIQTFSRMKSIIEKVQDNMEYIFEKCF